MLLPPPTLLDTPIVVTGTALPPSITSLDEVMLDTDDLQRVAGRRLENALTAIPDIQTFRRADSGSSHPTASGLTARGLGGNAASRMLVVMDGVPQSDPFGGWVDWPALGIDRIGSVRIDRGGGQTRWGNGAIAGLVEIETIVPEKGERFELRALGGSRSSLDSSGLVTIAGNRSYLVAGGGFRRSDGFIPIAADDRGAADMRAPYRQWNAGLRGVTALSSDLELQGGVQIFDDRRERGLEDSANRTRGTDLSLRLVGQGLHPFQISLFRQQRRFLSRFAATDADRSTSRLALDQYRVPASGWGARGDWDVVKGGSFSVRIGADARTGRGKTHEHYLYVDDTPTRDRAAGGRFATQGVFVDLSGHSGRLDWALSGRIDHWALTGGTLTERVIGGAVLTDSNFDRRSGWEPGGRLSVGTTLADVRLEGAVYHGWRLPTLNELYRPFRVGTDAFAANPALDPETVDGAEFSARIGGATGWSGGITLFANRLRDAIANVTLGQGPGNFPGVGFVAAGGSYAQRLNVDALESEGVEANVDWRRGPWHAGLAGSTVRARMRASGLASALDGNRPAQVPALSVVASAGWEPGERRSVDIRLRYLSGAFDDDGNRDRLHSALTVEASAQWPLTRRLSLLGSVENLFDSQVETGISSDGSVERSGPRTLWLGLSLNH